MKPLILAGSLSLPLPLWFSACLVGGLAAPEAPDFLPRARVVAAAPQQEPAAEATARPAWVPEGMVHIPAGTTIIGQEQKAAEARIREERNKDNRWIMGGEVGRHSVRVEDFWLAPTKVTNEMYLEFVKDSGARPPATWAVVPRELKERIITENKQKDPGFVWDETFQGRWWEMNWRDPAYTWAMPPERALEPVVFVTYDEAQAYCAWAGLRLPTEEELVRAGRGDGDLEYPFGKEFKREIVAHNTTLPSGLAFKRLPVAMLPNASPYGIYDLVGNVWEWTTSEYVAYEAFPRTGFKTKVKEQVTDDKGKTKTVEKEVLILPNWDASRRVIKGGCFTVDPNFCRLDVRVGFDPNFAAQVVGFRVASSGVPAADGAAMRARGLRTLLLGGKPEKELDAAQTLGLERRSLPDMSAIAARRAPPEKPVTMPQLPAAYRVFGRSEMIAVTPRRDPFAGDNHPETTSIDREARKSLQFPVLGVMTTDVALAEPWVPAGTYVLAWMPSFKLEEILEMGGHVAEDDMPKNPPARDEAKKPGFDLSQVILHPTHEHLLFVNADGVAVGAVKLVDDLKNQAEKVLKHQLTLDFEKDAFDYHLRVPGRSGKAYGVRFRVRAFDAAGASWVRRDHWTGNYAEVRLPPGAKVPLPPKEPKLPTPPAASAEAAPAAAGK